MLILTHSHVFLIIIYIISTNACVIWREEKREGKRCTERQREEEEELKQEQKREEIGHKMSWFLFMNFFRTGD